jgi:hypothetical protein
MSGDSSYKRKGELMKYMQLFSMLLLAGTGVVFNAGPAWTQTTPAPGEDQTKMKESKGERTGEEKERKKGEEEMEARGAQKPGRMGRPGAETPEAKRSQGETWTRQDIRRAQEALKDKGHDPGLIDGAMGPQTIKAIKAFQNANGIKETGRLDAETANKLGFEKAATSTESRTMDKGQTSSPMKKEAPSPTGK